MSYQSPPEPNRTVVGEEIDERDVSVERECARVQRPDRHEHSRRTTGGERRTQRVDQCPTEPGPLRLRQEVDVEV